MQRRTWLTLFLPAFLPLTFFGANTNSEVTPANPPRATLVGTWVLPRTSLSQFGNPAYPEAALAQARSNGLQFIDLPSIGSGLARAGENEFWGITDRGPNGNVGDEVSRRTFPLPQFCPAIVRFKLAGAQIQITGSISLRDSRGKRISGLNNLENEERLYESPRAAMPIAPDPNGVDPEGIRVLPDGNFLLSEEYSPSILVVATNGQVLVRYTPVSKPLTNATYLIRPILPDVFTQRRVNHGFENLALSSDGRFAYAILQSPMGDVSRKEFSRSRVMRALKLDVSQPLDAKVAGEYLLLASPARAYSGQQKQEKISWSDADWVAPDRLLIIERAKGEARLLLVDLSHATNVLERKEEADLVFENTASDLAALGIQTASEREIFSTRDVPGIDSDKIEGLAILSPTEIALANDNDFGIGENQNGEPSKIWIVRLAEPLPLSR
jgi:alkaline phosphatase